LETWWARGHTGAMDRPNPGAFAAGEDVIADG
jgi:hypothetical protein